MMLSWQRGVRDWLVRRDARIKTLLAIAAVTALSQSDLQHWPAILAAVGVMAGLLLIIRTAPRLILSRLALVAPLLIAFALSQWMWPTPATTEASSFWTVSLGHVPVHGRVLGMCGKILGCVLTLILLADLTPFNALMQGLRRMRLPGGFVAMVGLTWRYLFVLQREATTLHHAATMRGFRVRSLWNAGRLGTLAGTLFVRSLLRSERVYTAMRCRGFTGDWPAPPARRLSAGDWVVTCVGLFGLTLWILATT